MKRILSIAVLVALVAIFAGDRGAAIADGPDDGSPLSTDQPDMPASYGPDDAGLPTTDQPVTPAPDGVPMPLSIAPYDSGTWRLQIPDIGVDSPIVAVALESDGALGAPAGPDVVGWYQAGASPGGPGNALLDGHVDWTDRTTGIPRGAVFWSLRQLGAGSDIIFTDGVTAIVYQVVEKRRYRGDDPAGADVLQPTDDSRLTLITCGGTFDRSSRSYDQRDVIIAVRTA